MMIRAVTSRTLSRLIEPSRILIIVLLLTGSLVDVRAQTTVPSGNQYKTQSAVVSKTSTSIAARVAGEDDRTVSQTDSTSVTKAITDTDQAKEAERKVTLDIKPSSPVLKRVLPESADPRLDIKRGAIEPELKAQPVQPAAPEPLEPGEDSMSLPDSSVLPELGGGVSEILPPDDISTPVLEPPLRQLLITANTIAEAEVQRRWFKTRGVGIVSRRKLAGLGMVLSTFRVPSEQNMTELLHQAQEAFEDARVEINQRFRLLRNEGHKPSGLSKKRRYAQGMVGVSVPSRCQQPVAIAMLDSQVNTEVLAADAERIEVFDATGKQPPADEHGTAIANLLLSSDLLFPGLLPQASLFAVNVFVADSSGRQETRTDWLLNGLNAVISRPLIPAAVNLSFGGESSELLELALARLAKKTLLVAAAGNQGKEDKVYPAAYEAVYAVGAVDARGQRSRLSNYGQHVRFMAPGEDVWTRNGLGGGFYASGTSFAVPFVTAGLALNRFQGATVATYQQKLRDNGLVDLGVFCP